MTLLNIGDRLVSIPRFVPIYQAILVLYVLGCFHDGPMEVSIECGVDARLLCSLPPLHQDLGNSE